MVKNSICLFFYSVTCLLNVHHVPGSVLGTLEEWYEEKDMLADHYCVNSITMVGS